MRNVKKRTTKIVSLILSFALLLSFCVVSNAGGVVLASGDEALNRSEAVLFIGENVYSANTTYLSTVSEKEVLVWQSSNEEVAIVSPQGVVTAVGVGEATITAFTNNSFGKCEVTVTTMPEELTVPENGNDNYSRASVHDPEIIYVEDEECYYMLCTHNRSISKSTDLLKWQSVGISIDSATTNSEAAQFFREAHGTAGNAFWAPDVFYNKVTGKYHVYYSVSSSLNDGGRGFGNRASAIGMATLEPTEGEETYSLGTSTNWVDGGFVVGSYDAWRPGGQIVNGMGRNYKLGTNNVKASEFAPNAIDPMIIWENGTERLYMVYGSFFGGIFVLELDPETGLPFSEEDLNPEDENYEVRSNHGKCVANRGGIYAFAEPLDQLRKNTRAGIEGPTMFYNEDTGYYYLITSYDYLDTDYNMRVGRSKTIDGPFYDYNGFNLITGAEENLDRLNPDTIFTYAELENLPANRLPNEALGENDKILVDMDKKYSYDPNVGTKMMGPYRFLDESQDWVATGHNATFQAADGTWLVGMHAKNPQTLHIRALLWTDEGWPMASPSRYTGEDINQTIDASRVAGRYQMLIQDRLLTGANNTHVARAVYVDLNADYTVSSETAKFNGTWRMMESNKIEVTVDEETYAGQVSVGYNWGSEGGYQFVFAGLSSDGTMLWGKGGDIDTVTPITAVEKNYNNFTVRAGDIVKVPLQIFNGNDVAGVDLTASYDESLLTLISVNANEGFMLVPNNSAGKIRFVALSSSSLGIDGDMTIATAQFVANKDITITTNTKLVVESKVMNSDTQYTNDYVVDSYITIISPLKGDINGDGVVDMADALMALQFVSENRELNKYQLSIGDMNNDSKITLADVLIIMNVIVS